MHNNKGEMMYYVVALLSLLLVVPVFSMKQMVKYQRVAKKGPITPSDLRAIYLTVPKKSDDLVSLEHSSDSASKEVSLDKFTCTSSEQKKLSDDIKK